MITGIVIFCLAAILGCSIFLIITFVEISSTLMRINESFRYLNRTLMGINNELYKFENIKVNVHTNKNIENAD